MIIPGILETTFEQVQKAYDQISSEAEKIQIDIADGILVEGKTFTNIEKLIELDGHASLQIHLMVQKPETLIAIIPPNIKDVCTQIEAYMYRVDYLQGFIDILRAKDIRTGLSFNPQTSWKDYNDYISHFDYIQFMSIEPGAQGREFDDSVLAKIKDFRKVHPNINLQVDGGVNIQNLIDLVKVGTNSLVVGSQIFADSEKVEQRYKDFVIEFEHAQRQLHHST